ncbi:MAG: alpha/beta hydrolase-fold protein [Limisphaerales bacterium]
MSAQLKSAGIEHVYEEFPGGHEWPYWEAHLADMLRFFGRVLNGSEPRRAPS